MSESNENFVERQIVLGAGASRNCDNSGFPLGSGLKDEILGLLSVVSNTVDRKEGGCDSDIYHKLKEFLENFKTSGLDSIDAFIARTSDQDNVERTHDLGFAHGLDDISSDKIGCALIAAIIRHYQDKKTEIEWYGKLIPLFFPAIKIEDSAEDILTEFEKNIKNLRVITFNYDLSLECFLYEFLVTNYTKRKGFNDKYRRLMLAMIRDSIKHVYGAIYKPEKMIEKIIQYSASEASFQTVDPEKKPIQNALNSIEIIQATIALYHNRTPEDSHDIQVMERKNENREVKVGECQYLYVLGFGFDPENIKTIGLNRLSWNKNCFVTNFENNQKISRIAYKTLSSNSGNGGIPTISTLSVKQALEEDFSLSEETSAEQIKVGMSSSESPYLAMKKYEK